MKTTIKRFLLNQLDTYFISEITGVDIHPINAADKFILKETLSEYHIKSSIIADSPNGRSVIYDEGNEIELVGKVIIPNQYRIKENFKLNLKQYPDISPVLLPKGFIVNKVEDKKNNRKGYILDFKQLSQLLFVFFPILDNVFIPDWVLDNKNLCEQDERFVIN